ncbi:hypothetical protein ABG299_001080 [Salmonella enterica subsp. enterica]
MSKQDKPAESTKPQSPAQTEKPVPAQQDKFRVERMICNDSAENLEGFRKKDK